MASRRRRRADEPGARVALRVERVRGAAREGVRLDARQTSLVFTIAVVTFAITFIFGGRLQDRRGPRAAAFIGAVLVSLGFFLTSLTSSLTFLYVVFGVIVGAGNGFGYATPMPVASKWFPDKRGLVVGMMVGGYGAGSAIIGPLATSLIASIGWRTTFRILGVAFLVMGMSGTFC